MATLDEAYDEIISAIIQAITDECVPGGSLEGVSEVVRGDRARPVPTDDSIWVVPAPAANAPSDFGTNEEWRLPVAIAGMTVNDDPDEASRTVARITARARAAAIKDTTFGLDYIIDVVSKEFDPSSRTSGNRTIHWADATIEVTFEVTE